MRWNVSLSLACIALLGLLGGWGNSAMGQDASELLRDDLSATSERSADYAESASVFDDEDFQTSLDAAEGAGIVMYSSSPRAVKKAQGAYQISISSFSPISSVIANGSAIAISGNPYEVTFFIDYDLQPRDNVIFVEVISELGKAEKEFRIFLDTPEFTYADLARARKSSFTGVAILGLSRDDNMMSTPGDHVIGSKGSLTAVAVGQIATGFSSALVITGIVNVDDQHQSEFTSREILFRQLSVDWNDRETRWGDLTAGVGYNTVGLRNMDRSSEYRDSWNSDYSEGPSELYLNLQAKMKVWEQSQWKSSYKYGRKSTPGVAESTNSQKLGQALGGVRWGVQWDGSLGYSLTDAPGELQDLSKLEGSLKGGLKLKPVEWSLEYGRAETQYRTAEPTTGVRTQNTTVHLVLGANWPITSGVSLAYSHRLEIQESNLADSDYQKNLDTLNLTLIF